MNRVLAAERMSQVQLVEARAKADVQKIEVLARAENQRTEAEAHAASSRLTAESAAETERIRTAAEVESLRQREQTAAAYASHPALLRLVELEALKELGQNANARIYIGIDKHFEAERPA